MKIKPIIDALMQTYLFKNNNNDRFVREAANLFRARFNRITEPYKYMYRIFIYKIKQVNPTTIADLDKYINGMCTTYASFKVLTNTPLESLKSVSYLEEVTGLSIHNLLKAFSFVIIDHSKMKLEPIVLEKLKNIYEKYLIMHLALIFSTLEVYLEDPAHASSYFNFEPYYYHGSKTSVDKNIYKFLSAENDNHFVHTDSAYDCYLQLYRKNLKKIYDNISYATIPTLVGIAENIPDFAFLFSRYVSKQKNNKNYNVGECLSCYHIGIGRIFDEDFFNKNWEISIKIENFDKLNEDFVIEV